MYEVALVQALVFVLRIRCDFFFCRVIMVGRKCNLIFFISIDFHVLTLGTMIPENVEPNISIIK